jgi:hypothetical protein
MTRRRTIEGRVFEEFKIFQVWEESTKAQEEEHHSHKSVAEEKI